MKLINQPYAPKRKQEEKKMEAITGGWKRISNEELHRFHTSPNIIRMEKIKRMRWTDHAARMRREMHIINLGRKTLWKEASWKT